jgi:hypothetical protein
VKLSHTISLTIERPYCTAGVEEDIRKAKIHLLLKRPGAVCDGRSIAVDHPINVWKRREHDDAGGDLQIIEN